MMLYKILKANLSPPKGMLAAERKGRLYLWRDQILLCLKDFLKVYAMYAMY